VLIEADAEDAEEPGPVPAGGHQVTAEGANGQDKVVAQGNTPAVGGGAFQKALDKGVMGKPKASGGLMGKAKAGAKKIGDKVSGALKGKGAKKL